MVNGFPDTQSAGRFGDSPEFGQVCFDLEGADPGDACFDFATGEDAPPSRPAPAPTPTPTAAGGGNLTSGIGMIELGEDAGSAGVNAPAAVGTASVQAASATAPGTRAGMISGAEHQAQGNGVDFAIQAPHNGVETAEEESQAPGDPQPAPTLSNGLPGATDFIPDNIDPTISADPAEQVNARYYDVTLSETGTTTLSSDRTIDRLSVGGLAGLNIAANGSLTSLIDVTQTGGRISVDGSLTSADDYSLIMGLLTGSGTISAPMVTSVAGGIAPGTMGTIGTLTVDGNLILSSGTTLFMDLGAANSSDQIAVTGEANLGGNVAIGNVGITQTATPNTYRILTADGGITDQFDGVSNLSAILLSSLIYSSNAVDLQIRAQSYQNVIDSTNAVQVSYAALLDRNRGNGDVSELFSFLDFTDAATIQSTLNS
ncbi:autotransporter outer membrane beta-barrel domain-containing protein [Parasphingorhabdus sp.]|uniref:autotransporter outer membrane beta-barrel domain-containing protein n=1 Tax=Parasphingorhabdus sp. TaxID=2709688 RepID=UPI00300287AE